MLSSWSHFMIRMKNCIAHLCLLRKLLSEWVKWHQFYTHCQHRWVPLCLKSYYPSYSLKQNSFLPLQNFFILLLNCSVSSMTCNCSFSSTHMTQLLPSFPPLAVDKPVFNLLSKKHANIFWCLLLPNKCFALLSITKCISFYWVWSFAFILPLRYFLEHLYKLFGVWKNLSSRERLKKLLQFSLHKRKQSDSVTARGYVLWDWTSRIWGLVIPTPPLKAPPTHKPQALPASPQHLANQ